MSGLEFNGLVPERNNVSGRFGSIVGPFLFAVVSQVTGGSRLSILSLIVFFVGGMAILSRVDERAGRAAARSTLELT